MKQLSFVLCLALAACSKKAADKAVDKAADKAPDKVVGDKPTDDQPADDKPTPATEHHGGGGKAGTSDEAAVRLNALGKRVKAFYAENAGFPKGKVGPTPAKACCPDACAPDPAAWGDATWKALEFTVDEPSRAQFTYESDGATGFTATAIEGCDGTPVTLTLTGKADKGNVTTEITGG